MRVGIHYVSFSNPGDPASIGPALAEAARTAEDGGVAVFTLMDHWFQLDQFFAAEEPMLEGYTSLGFLAGQTSRMKLGLLVTGVTYRHPGLLAKIVTTLDVLSGGRARLGLGAAWYEREHKGLGVAFPAVSERFERLEETLQICLQMWSDDDGPFVGRHYQLAETLCSPRPVSSPRPEILVGGGGEKKTLKLVARYADACNLATTSATELAHKLEVLARHCESEGRDPGEIDKTILHMGTPLADPDAFVATMADYAALGVGLVELMPFGDPVAYVTEVCDRLVPALADL
ncbi:MAG: LLM class F420-dependent oxidoreductase [Acidimicrobiia bacterium]